MKQSTRLLRFSLNQKIKSESNLPVSLHSIQHLQLKLVILRKSVYTMLTILDAKQNQRTFKSSLTLGKPACTSREFRNTILIVSDIMTTHQIRNLLCSGFLLALVWFIWVWWTGNVWRLHQDYQYSINLIYTSWY